MAIPDHLIDQIQERTDIVEVISKYVALKKVGRNYKSTCPFHHEKTPSFVVSPDKQIYHCFGCGAGGNVFSFVMRYENMQFPEAVESLAGKAGVVLPRQASQSSASSSLANQLYRVNELACQFFQATLANNAAANEYLASRGIAEDAKKKFKIGYAPESWEALLNFFKSKGVSVSLVEKAGLAVANDKGGHYDRFRKRIIFPITDLKDRILGFGARVLDASLPKYLNSPETVIYSKGKNLYGLNLSREAIKKEGHALVVEGYLDFIIPYQAGIQNIIATLGTALTIDQIKLLKRFGNTVIMVYDPDAAGESASLRNLDLFITEDVNVYIAELSDGLDPDSYIRKKGAEDFLKLIKSSKNLFDYKLDKLKNRFNISTTHGKVNIVNEMVPTIAKINNAVFKADLIKKLSEKLSVNEDAIREELKKVKPGAAERVSTVIPVEAKKDYWSAEIMILALLLAGNSFIKVISEELSPEEFKDTSIRDLVVAILELYKQNVPVNAAKVINHMGSGDRAANLVSEAVNMLEPLADKEKAMADCIARIKKDNVKDRLADIQDALRMAHSQKDEEKVKSLVAEYNSLMKAGKV